jgi:uncharacterized protein YeaO (DUF488 family)
MIYIVQLGSSRSRGVRKEDWRSLNYFDIRFPNLAPSAELLRRLRKDEISFTQFQRLYRSEMKAPERQHEIRLLAELSRKQNLSVGCYCVDFEQCHRSILSDLFTAAGATVALGRKAHS